MTIASGFTLNRNCVFFIFILFSMKYRRINLTLFTCKFELVRIMDDIKFIDEIRESNKKAFKQMFTKYYSPLCEYASQYVSDEDAEELVQDLMLYIWENREVVLIDISLKSYLFMAVKHRCLNAIKKQLYHERVHSMIYEKLKDQFEDPDYYFINELSLNITNAINELPENYRETFKLSRFGEKSNSEIADALGISVKTVEYRITQSLKILRTKLKDYLPLIWFLMH